MSAAPEEDPHAEIDCSVTEVKALLLSVLTAAQFYVGSTSHGFNIKAFDKHMNRAQDLAGVLDDMLRPPAVGFSDEEPF